MIVLLNRAQNIKIILITKGVLNLSNKYKKFFSLVYLVLLTISINSYGFGKTTDTKVQITNRESGYEINAQYQLPGEPTLDDYIQAALFNNPNIQSIHAQWNAELNKIAVAKGFPNPNISLGYFVENVETAVGPQNFKIGINQPIPWFGKLKLNGEIQSLRADILEVQLQNKINNIKYNVTNIFFNYYFIERSISITFENIELLRNWEEVVRNKYMTAQLRHPDLIKAQIELMNLENDLITLEEKRKPLRDQMRAIINDSTLTNINVPDSISFVLPNFTQNELKNIINVSNPLLTISRMQVEVGQRSISREKLKYFPDLGIGMDYIVTGEKSVGGNPVIDSGRDPLVFKINLSLPIWIKKNRQQVLAAKNMHKSYELNFVDLKNQLTSDLEEAFFEFRDSERKIDLYVKGLIPKSIESLKASEKAYITDQIDFLNLVDAQRRYLKFLLDYEQSLVRNNKAFARLENLAGRQL